MTRRRAVPRALTIAGSDSSGGAGIQADLATFGALGVFGASAVTAVTAQDTRGVEATAPVAVGMVAAQIDAVLDDIGADAVKTGMLCSRNIVRTVVKKLAAAGAANLVVDPVVRSTSGAELLDRGGLRALRDSLLPLARVVTPNLAEASALADMEVNDVLSAAEACRRILRFGSEHVVVTGGHLAGAPIDLLAGRGGIRRFVGRRVGGGAHGTGCVFSAALAAHLARGRDLDDAVAAAKRFVESRLRRALALGRGRRVLDLRIG
jgi:hydroxymethylpyrimidine/phosphomethylpyrimidine kinase